MSSKTTWSQIHNGMVKHKIPNTNGASMKRYGDSHDHNHKIKMINWNWTLNPLMTDAPHHIETSQLICRANQLTGFYMMGNTGC